MRNNGQNDGDKPSKGILQTGSKTNNPSKARRISWGEIKIKEFAKGEEVDNQSGDEYNISLAPLINVEKTNMIKEEKSERENDSLIIDDDNNKQINDFRGNYFSTNNTTHTSNNNQIDSNLNNNMNKKPTSMLNNYSNINANEESNSNSRNPFLTNFNNLPITSSFEEHSEDFDLLKTSKKRLTIPSINDLFVNRESGSAIFQENSNMIYNDNNNPSSNLNNYPAEPKNKTNLISEKQDLNLNVNERVKVVNDNHSSNNINNINVAVGSSNLNNNFSTNQNNNNISNVSSSNLELNNQNRLINKSLKNLNTENEELISNRLTILPKDEMSKRMDEFSKNDNFSNLNNANNIINNDTLAAQEKKPPQKSDRLTLITKDEISKRLNEFRNSHENNNSDNYDSFSESDKLQKKNKRFTITIEDAIKTLYNDDEDEKDNSFEQRLREQKDLNISASPINIRSQKVFYETCLSSASRCIETIEKIERLERGETKPEINTINNPNNNFTKAESNLGGELSNKKGNLNNNINGNIGVINNNPNNTFNTGGVLNNNPINIGTGIINNPSVNNPTNTNAIYNNINPMNNNNFPSQVPHSLIAQQTNKTQENFKPKTNKHRITINTINQNPSYEGDRRITINTINHTGNTNNNNENSYLPNSISNNNITNLNNLNAESNFLSHEMMNKVKLSQPEETVDVDQIDKRINDLMNYMSDANKSKQRNINETEKTINEINAKIKSYKEDFETLEIRKAQIKVSINEVEAETKKLQDKKSISDFIANFLGIKVMSSNSNYFRVQILNRINISFKLNDGLSNLINLVQNNLKTNFTIDTIQFEILKPNSGFTDKFFDDEEVHKIIRNIYSDVIINKVINDNIFTLDKFKEKFNYLIKYSASFLYLLEILTLIYTIGMDFNFKYSKEHTVVLPQFSLISRLGFKVFFQFELEILNSFFGLTFRDSTVVNISLSETNFAKVKVKVATFIEEIKKFLSYKEKLKNPLFLKEFFLKLSENILNL